MSRPLSTGIGLIGASSLLLVLSGCGSDNTCGGDSCSSGAGGATSALSGGKSSVAAGGATSLGSGGTVSKVTGGASNTSSGGATATTGGTTATAAGGTDSGGVSTASGGVLTTSGGAAAGGASSPAVGGSTPIASGGVTLVPVGGTSAVAAGGTEAASTGGTTATAAGGKAALGGSATTASGGTTIDSVGGATSENAGGTLATGGSVAATGGTTEVSAGGADAGTPPGPEVILKYDFEDGTGTTVTDLAGNGNNGTLVSAGWTANTEGRNGIATHFENTDSAVALPNDLFAGAKELTVSSWVFLTDNQAWNHLFDFGTGTENDLYFTLNNSSGGMELGLRLNGNAPQTLFTTTMLPLNVWKHVAITLSSRGTFIYVDGREVARAPGLVIAPSLLGVTTSNWIGKSQFPYPQFNGRMDEFYIYGRALAQNEIAQLAWPKHDYSIWHFDETSGTVARDSSDNARDGTLVNATWTSGVFGGGVQLYNPGAVSAPSANDQFVQLPNGILKDCTQGYTVTAWINPAAVFAHQRVFNFGNDAGSFVAARTMGGWTQQIALVNRTDSTERYANIDFSADDPWKTGTWYHVAMVREGQTLRAYLNGSTTGVASAENTVTEPMPTADAMGDTPYNYIGKAMPTATDSRLHGFVDEFLVSCRPFTADEIMQLAYRPPS